MNQYIYITIFVVTEVLNYLLTYHVVFGYRIRKNKLSIACCLAILYAVHISITIVYDAEKSSAISIITMLVVPLFLIDYNKLKCILIFPFIIMCFSTIALSSSFILALIFNVSEYDTINENAYAVVCQMTPIIIMGAFALRRKIKKIEIREVNLRVSQYILFYIVAICLFFMYASIQLLSVGMINSSNINILGCALSVISIVLILIAILQGIIVDNNVRLKEINRVNEELLQLQKDYYSQLLKQDEKMQRFRHDLTTHLIALQALCDEKNNKEAQNYINRIIGESAIYDNKIYTGIKSVDAVIYDLLDTAVQNKIDVKITGRISDAINVSEFDLCTIFSNLIRNAIESNMKLDNINDRNICIEMGMYNTKSYIMIENACEKGDRNNKNLLISSKSKSKYHGLGCGNVKNAVEKYDGLIEFKAQEDKFIVEIVI